MERQIVKNLWLPVKVIIIYYRFKKRFHCLESFNLHYHTYLCQFTTVLPKYGQVGSCKSAHTLLILLFLNPKLTFILASRFATILLYSFEIADFKFKSISIYCKVIFLATCLIFYVKDWQYSGQWAIFWPRLLMLWASLENVSILDYIYLQYHWHIGKSRSHSWILGSVIETFTIYKMKTWWRYPLA